MEAKEMYEIGNLLAQGFNEGIQKYADLIAWKNTTAPYSKMSISGTA